MKKKLIVTMVVMLLSMVLALTAFAGTASDSYQIHGYYWYGHANCSDSGGFGSLSFETLGNLAISIEYCYLDDDMIAGILENESGNQCSSLVTTYISKPVGFESGFTDADFWVEHEGATSYGGAFAEY